MLLPLCGDSSALFCTMSQRKLRAPRVQARLAARFSQALRGFPLLGAGTLDRRNPAQRFAGQSLDRSKPRLVGTKIPGDNTPFWTQADKDRYRYIYIYIYIYTHIGTERHTRLSSPHPPTHSPTHTHTHTNTQQQKKHMRALCEYARIKAPLHWSSCALPSPSTRTAAGFQEQEIPSDLAE